MENLQKLNCIFGWSDLGLSYSGRFDFTMASLEIEQLEMDMPRLLVIFGMVEKKITSSRGMSISSCLISRLAIVKSNHPEYESPKSLHPKIQFNF